MQLSRFIYFILNCPKWLLISYQVHYLGSVLFCMGAPNVSHNALWRVVYKYQYKYHHPSNIPGAGSWNIKLIIKDTLNKQPPIVDGPWRWSGS